MQQTATPQSDAARAQFPAMRADFINPFITSTVRVIATMASIQPQPGRPRIKPDLRTYADVTGIIGLLGEGVEGTMAISFAEACILRVVSNMLGEEITDLNNEIEDAVGELTNMISGAARAELETKGYSFRMAIPSVITRRGHSIAVITRFPIVQIPFETDYGPFYVEACLHQIPK
ncbi:chemotaxis protein CheX [Myxococcota bacterium]|nr:chemotaxis protein CheX [Myxococcota bacterium]